MNHSVIHITQFEIIAYKDHLQNFESKYCKFNHCKDSAHLIKRTWSSTISLCVHTILFDLLVHISFFVCNCREEIILTWDSFLSSITLSLVIRLVGDVYMVLLTYLYNVLVIIFSLPNFGDLYSIY